MFSTSKTSLQSLQKRKIRSDELSVGKIGNEIRPQPGFFKI